MGTKCNAASTLVTTCSLQYGGTGQGCQPPNLITTLINIALKPGTVDEPMFANQGSIQSVILLIAFFAVPWLLLAKPMYLKQTHKPVEVHSTGSENPLLAGEDHGHANPHGSGTIHTLFPAFPSYTQEHNLCYILLTHPHTPSSPDAPFCTLSRHTLLAEKADVDPHGGDDHGHGE